jgi:hypothetical protein
VKRCGSIVMDVGSIPAHPFERTVLKTMHRAPIIQMVKQLIQPFSERYTKI